MYVFIDIDRYMWMDDCVRFQGGGFIGTGLILCLSSGLGSDYFAFTQKTENGCGCSCPNPHLC